MLGGSGSNGIRHEQPFAAGYSACFIGMAWTPASFI